jgi:hypothetical protein
VVTGAGGQWGARRPSFISTPRSDAYVHVEEFARRRHPLLRVATDSLSDVARLLGISENAGALALARHRIEMSGTPQYHFCAGERHCQAIHKSDAMQDVRAQVAQILIEHKADLGPEVALASDQAILDRVDDITEVLFRGLTTALTEGDADWLRRYAWFVDLVTAILEDAAGKPLDE